MKYYTVRISDKNSSHKLDLSALLFVANLNILPSLTLIVQDDLLVQDFSSFFLNKSMK